MRTLSISILRFLWPLAVIAVLITPLIGMTISWFILAVLAIVTGLFSVTWLFQTQGELYGQVIAVPDEDQIHYFFKLTGDPENIEKQDVIVFEVVRDAGNSSP